MTMNLKQKLQKKIARIGVHYRKNTKYVNEC